jgi:cytochrome c oxidase subunit 4
MQDLIIVSHDAYTALRQSLKALDVDLCYSASSSRPLRTHWAPERAHEAKFRQAVAERRPADANFRIASVEVVKPGNRWWPDQLAVTFHAVSETQEAALQQYLTAQGIGVLEPKPVEHEHAAAGHASSVTYIQIALILAVLTALEVAASYLPDGMQPPSWMFFIVLVLLSVMKFGLVASYFMHLRYDHRIYASCFAAGLLVAAGTILALVALFREPSNLMVATAEAHTPLQRPVSSDIPHGHAVNTPPMPSEAGNANAGSGVFEKYGCGACHTVFYPTYEVAQRLVALSPLEDQQLGGIVMKLASTAAFVMVLGRAFGRWYRAESARMADRPQATVSSHPPTY